MMQSGRFRWITHTCFPGYKLCITNAHKERYKLRVTKIILDSPVLSNLDYMEQVKH